MIEQLLHQLGFTPKETVLYLAILKHGKITPADLAEITNINRTTVYAIAKELLKRRIIAEDLESPRQYLLARAPAELLSLIQQEESQLNERKKTAQQAVRALEAMNEEVVYSIPKVSFIREEELENYLYSRTPEWNRSLEESDAVWWGFQDDTFVANYARWISWYWEQAAEPGIELRLLSNDSEVEREMQTKGYTNRNIRYWKGLKVDATTWVIGDFLVMIVSNKRPHYLVEIHDRVLARNQREVFQRIWQTLERAEKTAPWPRVKK